MRERASAWWGSEFPKFGFVKIAHLASNHFQNLNEELGMKMLLNFPRANPALSQAALIANRERFAWGEFFTRGLGVLLSFAFAKSCSRLGVIVGGVFARISMRSGIGTASLHPSPTKGHPA